MAAPTTLAEALVAIAELQAKFAEEHPDAACPPEECVPLDESETGTHIVVTDAETSCPVSLTPPTGMGLVHVNGTTVDAKDGSVADPIQLDSLTPSQGDFKGLIELTEDGTFRHWKPLPGDCRTKLTAKGGTISQTEDKTYNEFPVEDIPEVCCNDMTYIIGGVVSIDDCGRQIIKLVKIPRSTFYSCICKSCNVESYDEVWDII